MDDMKIELGQPGPFAAGVMAGIKASDAIDVPGETTLDQLSAFFWLHVGTSMASAGLVDAEAQALFVEGAKTRAPSRESEPEARTDEIAGRPSERIPAVRIWLHRAEGLHAECTEHTFEGPDVWRQARHQLDKWSYTAPDDGTVDKTDFKVTYEGGHEYSGTFGLQRYDVDLPAHMRGHLQHLLAHPEVYAKYVDEARKFLDRYEIGPNV